MSPGGSVTAVHTTPYRIRAPVVRDVPAGQCGTENGPVAYARLILASGPHAAVATAHVAMQGGGRKRKLVADSNGAGAAEVHDGEVAAEQMRCKPDSSGGGQVPDNEQNNDLSCLVLLTGKMLFFLIVSVLSATTCVGKVGKRLPEGPHKRRGGAAARCRRHRSSGDARRRHSRSPRTRTPPNGSTSESASADRRGRGTLPRQVGKRLPEGTHERRGGAAARCRRHRSSGDARRRLAEPACP